MKVDTKKYAIALYELAAETPPADLKPVLADFAGLLAKKRLLKYWEKILKDFCEYYKRREKIATVSVLAAKELPAGEKEELTRKLEKLTGKKVELRLAVDPEIIGGLVIKIEDCLYDGSLCSKLAGLKEKLTI